MIIAVDFDGVLVEDKFPDIGKEDAEMVSLVRELIEKPGIEVVLWTSRVAGPLYNALSWCTQHKLFFDAINENAPSNRKKYEKIYPMGTRKVYANCYLDDHNLGYNRQQAIEILKSILKEEK